jgi:hypothetical protein
MTLRVCAEPNCPELTNSTRCRTHTRTKDRARGTRQARGYGAAYDNERRHYQRRMDKGERFNCWRCHEPITPGARWTLGHCDDHRELIHGPEHPTCNYATAGRTHCTHISHM